MKTSTVIEEIEAASITAIADPDQMVDTLADLDCLVLTCALEVLHRYGRACKVASLLVPVGYQTLARSRTRREYLMLLTRLPEVYVPFVKLEVSNAPSRPDVDQLNNLMFTVSAVRPDVTLQVSGHASYLGTVDPTPPRGLSCSLSMAQVRDPSLRLLSPAFWDFAKSNHLRTLAHSANTIGLALAAVDSGFDYISGAAIHLCQDTPQALSRLQPLTFPKTHFKITGDAVDGGGRPNKDCSASPQLIPKAVGSTAKSASSWDQDAKLPYSFRGTPASRDARICVADRRTGPVSVWFRNTGRMLPST